MYNFWTIIKSDYLQRTRGYGFLVALCMALALGYSFVPPLNASYSTISIGEYIGEYNSAWFGYVIAIMSSIFISLFGYFVINNTIKRDTHTNVGNIIATTQVKNISYLNSKMFSNLLVFLSISIPVLFMGMMLFFIYGDGSIFRLSDFIKPYVLVCLPVFVLTSGLALLLEAVFKSRTVLQYMVFFILFFGAILSTGTESVNQNFNPIGDKIITQQMIHQVNELSQEKQGLNIGFSLNDNTKTRTFKFSGVDFPANYIWSRLLWMMGGFVFMLLSGIFFSRFEKPLLRHPAENKLPAFEKIISHFQFEKSTSLVPRFSISPILKGELILLFRKTTFWSWVLTISLMVALTLAPLSIAHKIILPILWFVHITKWSRLTTKAVEHKMSLFESVSFNPISRLMTSQILAGVIASIALALPLIVRLFISGQMVGALSVILGAVFIVVLAVLLGLLCRGRKLFEVLFFILIYANLNSISQLDFFGGMHTEISYLIRLTLLVGAGLITCYFLKYTTKNISFN